MNKGLLDGVVVLDLTRVLAGPYSGLIGTSEFKFPAYFLFHGLIFRHMIYFLRLPEFFLMNSFITAFPLLK